MVRRPLTSEETKVRAYLLSGKTVSATASVLQIGKTRINKTIDSLIALGELVEDYYTVDGRPQRYNPRLFRAPSDSSAVNREDSPKGESSPKSDGIEGSNQILDPRTGPPTLETVGVSVSAECPEGYGEAHISGAYGYTVNAEGRTDRIADPEGYTIGYVSDKIVVVAKGGLQRHGALRMFNQEVTFDYRWFPTTGNRFLYLKPGRLYFDPRIYTTTEEILHLFDQRRRYVEYALALNGWVLTPNERFSGVVHIAWENHPLCKHFDPELYDPNADLVVDTSKGNIELEMEHSEDPLFNEKLRIMANLPTRIMDIESSIDGSSVSIQRIHEEIRELRGVCDEIIHTMARITEAQAMQLEYSVKQLQISNNLLKVQTNDSNIRLMQTQRSLDSYVDAGNQARGGRSVETRNKTLEGYQ